MADRISKRHRSWLMSQVKSKNTKPEVLARSLLHRLGYRFTVNAPNNKRLPGKPDIVLPKYHTVVFIHGCFWHRHKNCKHASTPKSNQAYWIPKFKRNIERDKTKQKELKKLGWQVIVIWECALKKQPFHVASQLINAMPREESYTLPNALEDLRLVAETQGKYGPERR